MKDSIRYFFGYLLGFSLFVVLVPYSLYLLAEHDSLLPGKGLIGADWLRVGLSVFLFLNGALFAAWSNLFLLKMGKGGPFNAPGVRLSPETKILVTGGPYKYSRNPMVFGAFSLYASVALYMNSILGLLVVLFLFFLMIFYLRTSEEKRLLKNFGEAYLDYKKRVPMIFPIKLG
jgi:protein-S-isoprenylcysteine O-methyltransferase Ste14